MVYCNDSADVILNILCGCSASNDFDNYLRSLHFLNS